MLHRHRHDRALGRSVFSCLLTVLVAMPALGCHGRRDRDVAGAGVRPATHVVFERRTLLGGSDLLVAPYDGAAAPVNVTRHRGEEIVDVRTRLVANRLVYRTRSDEPDPVEDYRSVVVPQDGSRAPLRLTAFEPDDEIVGTGIVTDVLVVQVRRSGVANLFAVPVDGRFPVRNLTQNTSPDVGLGWQPDWQTAGGRVFYLRGQFSAPDAPVELCAIDVRDPTSATVTIANPRTQLRPVASTLLSRAAAPPLIWRESLVAISETPGQERQLCVADLRDGGIRTLHPAWSNAGGGLLQAMLLDGVLFFTWQSSSPETLEVAAVDVERGGPSTSLLTLPTSGPERVLDLDAVARVPGRAALVLRVQTQDPTEPGRSIWDLYSVAADATADPIRRLTRPDLHVEDAAETIHRVLAIGSAVVFERAQQPAVNEYRLWVADTAVAGSETLLLPAVTDPQDLSDYLFTNFGAGTLDELAARYPDAEATDVVVDRALARVRSVDVLAGRIYTNLVAIAPNGSGVETVTVTAQYQIPDDVLVDGAPGAYVLGSKGNRVVYRRASALFSAAVDRLDEIQLTNTLTAPAQVLVGAGNLGGDRVLFWAGGQLFSHPVDQPYDRLEQTRQLTSVTPAEGVWLLGANEALALYTVSRPTVAGNVQEIRSAPIAPASPTSTSVSRTIDGIDYFWLTF